MKYAALLMALLLSACDQRPNPKLYRDQCLRADLFQKCLAGIPKGPERLTASGNDWDEAIGACENAAYYQSIRQGTPAKPECAVDY